MEVVPGSTLHANHTNTFSHSTAMSETSSQSDVVCYVRNIEQPTFKEVDESKIGGRHSFQVLILLLKRFEVLDRLCARCSVR